MDESKKMFDQAFMAAKNGDFESAEKNLRSILGKHPCHPETHNLLGVVLLESGRIEKAFDMHKKAVGFCPDNSTFQYHFGLSAVMNHRLDIAVEAFTAAIANNPDFSEAHYNLAKALKDAGDLNRSVVEYKKLLKKDPTHNKALYNLANLCFEQSNLDQAESVFKKLLSFSPDHLDAMTNLAIVYSEKGNRDQAIALLEKVIAQEPNKTDAMVQLRKLKSALVPSWHFDMLNDHKRNLAYDRAISKYAAKAGHVLEIGTGSGILSMMAARSGACKITTCEMNRHLAKTADKIIKKNGYDDKIKVIPKKSTRLSIKTDMPEKADLLIAEVLDVGLLGEHFIPALIHAKKKLLTRNPTIIPKAARISALLVECPHLRRVNPITTISGFDLSDFDVFRRIGYRQINLNSLKHKKLSNVATICHIDFQNDTVFNKTHTLRVDPIRTGTCHGVAFWFDLFLDEDTVLSSMDADGTNHWKQAIQFFNEDIPVNMGEPLQLFVEQRETSVRFRLIH